MAKLGDPMLFSSNEGIDKFGVNTDVDGAEDIWSGGGDFTWANVATDGAITVVSSNDEDGAGTSTGALTLEVEYLKQVTLHGKTGGQIVKKTVTLAGTTPVAVGTGGFVYRMRVLTTGSTGAAVGTITAVLATNTIARIEAGLNQTEMALMIVPQFDSMGQVIHGAFLHHWGAATVINTAANAQLVLQTALPGTTVWAIQRRGVLTVSNDINQEFHAPKFLKAGTKVRVRCTAVSATNQSISAYFTLEYHQ